MMFNYFGGPGEVLFRETVKFYDSNVFVTEWVTIMQLEAASFPGGPALAEEQLLLALDAIQGCHDHNREEGSSIVDFWPQTYDERTGMWVSEPTNFGDSLGDAKVLSDVLVWLLADLDLKNISEIVREYAATM